MHNIPESHHALAAASKDQGQLYALIDGALAPALEANVLEHRPPLDHMPLLIGGTDSFVGISPRLIRLSIDDDLLWWLLDEGQKASWGIFLCSQVEMSALYHHLFCLTAARHLNGQSVQFRYYDPRVLRPFWQVLTPEEQNQLMGPIQTILVEDEEENEPGFWAYRRPKELEQPPYPPTPKDWTSLPEPWWEITPVQQQALTDAVLQRFLRRFADYLAKKRDELRPDDKANFHAKAYQATLKNQARYFMQHGFETELQLAQALVCVQTVFSPNLHDKQVRKIVEKKDASLSEKIDTLQVFINF